jgi:hypothetical protein
MSDAFCFCGRRIARDGRCDGGHTQAQRAIYASRAQAPAVNPRIAISGPEGAWIGSRRGLGRHQIRRQPRDTVPSLS